MKALSRRSGVAPFRALDVMASAMALERQGRHIIHMAVGEPSASTPRVVREAVTKALDNGRIGYTEALGVPALRRRIAASYGEKHGIDVSPDRVAVTTGSSAAFNLAFLALFDVGDRVAIPTPGYPAYRNILKALGLEVVEIPTVAATRWTITPQLLAAANAEAPLKGVVVASPNNPSGTMMSPDDLSALVTQCDGLGIQLIVDEIYHGLSYGFPTETALSFSSNVVVINSFSKYYCMTGWRIGWMVMPETMTRAVERLAQNLSLSVNALSQHAGIAAFDATEELEATKAGYAANRLLLLDRLPQIGIDQFLPVDGAFYVYADVRRFTNDTVDFAHRLLAEAGVAVTPGIDFDTERGGGFIRLSFAGRHDDMADGLDRLSEWLK